MTFVLRLALSTFVLPLAPVAIAFVVARRSRAVGAVAAATGIVIAHLVDVGVPHLPPIDTIGWIPFAVAVASLGVFAEQHAMRRLALTFIIVTIATWLMGRPVWQSVPDAAPWCLLAGAVAALVHGSLEAASRSMAPGATLLAFAMTMAGASIACLFGHSALLAQVVGATAAVIGLSGVLGLFAEPAKALVGVATVAAVPVLVYARMYASLSTPIVALLIGAAISPLVVSRLSR